MGVSLVSNLSQFFSELEWRTVTQIYKGKYTVFGDNINPEDMSQKSLGDCYFMAAVAALCEEPGRIQRLFLSSEPNQQSLFAVRICVYGTWEVVFLDDWFAVDPFTGYTSAFSCTTNNQIWLMLLLKAWAKIFGGYLNISGGTCLEALTDLTGSPCSHLEVSSANETDSQQNWQSLVEASQNKFPVCASARKFATVDKDQKDPESGIITDHCYAVLGAFEVVWDEISQQYCLTQDPQKPGSGSQRILKLRNPWGESGFRIDWFEKNKTQLNAELKHQMLKTDAASHKPASVLFVEYNHFLRLFSGIDICMFRPEYELSSTRLESFPDKPMVLSFEVKVPGLYYISLHQISARAFKDSESKH